MPPKNKASKPPADKARASKTADVVATSTDNDAAPTLEEPTTTQLRDGGTTSPRNHEVTLVGDVQDVPLDRTATRSQKKMKTTRSPNKQET
jgi:hypothetical protein